MQDDFDYTPDLLTVSDDDGNDITFEIIDRIETDDAKYVAVVEYAEDPEQLLDEDGDVLILKVTEEGEEVYLSQIEQQDEFDAVYEIFEKRLEEFYEADEDETDADAE